MAVGGVPTLAIVENLNVVENLRTRLSVTGAPASASLSTARTWLSVKRDFSWTRLGKDYEKIPLLPSANWQGLPFVEAKKTPPLSGVWMMKL